MADGQENTLERLLAQEGWLQGLARALVGEASLADDVAQETWARVLAQPPRSVDSPRAWLARIARRVAGERVRDEHSRKRRERIAASERGEAVDETAWAARVEAAARVQQSLARAVLALSEPGRSAVVLRYFEGRSAARIARDTGVPESTVRNRLRRALAELRDALDREAGGDRSRWLPALLPVAGLTRSPLPNGPLLTAEVLLMGLKTKLAIGVALLALASIPFVLMRADEPRLAPAEPVAIAEPAGPLALHSESARAPVAEFIEAPEEARAGAVVAPVIDPPLLPGILEVVVVRSAASAAEPDIPVTGGRVWLGPPSVVFLPRDFENKSEDARVAELDVAGTARFQGVPPGRLPVGVQVRNGSLLQTHIVVPSGEGARCVVRLGDSGLKGTVRDPSGPLVAGARVQISPLHARWNDDEKVHVVTWTDDEGRYEALHLPTGAYGVGVDLSGLQNAAGGEYAITLELPASSVLEHDFGEPEGLPLWRGFVRTKLGEPASQPAEAVAHPGQIHLTRTDRWSYSHHPWEKDGSFAIRIEPGTYDVSISFPDRHDERFTVLEGLEVNPGAQSAPLELDLHIPGTTLTGFAAEGKWIGIYAKPGESPLVSWRRPPDGRYRFDGIPPGRWLVTAGNLTVECTVLESDVLLTIDLR